MNASIVIRAKLSAKTGGLYSQYDDKGERRRKEKHGKEC